MKNKLINRFIVLTLSLSMAFSITACGKAQQSDNGSTAAQESQVSEDNSDERTVTVTDMSGDEVTIKGEVKKIVNLWPAGTSSFFVMGAGDLLTGLSVNNPGTINDWGKLFYSDIDDIASMGGTTPTIEELLNLDPDLVIIHPMSAKDGYAQQIRDAGIPAININFSNYDDMITAYTMLGEILGGVYQERLDNWCDMVKEKQAEVASVTADVADEDKPVVYYIAGSDDSLTTTMGANSICASWTENAGGVYAASILDESANTEVTAEEIFALDPDVIIVGGTWQHKIVEELKNTDGWKDLKAVVNNRVYTNPYGAFAWDRFGLESYLQLDYSLMCIQPELAETAGVTRESMINEVIDFYQQMNGTVLTEAQASNMLDGLAPDGTEVEPSAGNGQGGQGGQSH